MNYGAHGRPRRTALVYKARIYLCVCTLVVLAAGAEGLGGRGAGEACGRPPLLYHGAPATLGPLWARRAPPVPGPAPDCSGKWNANAMDSTVPHSAQPECGRLNALFRKLPSPEHGALLAVGALVSALSG
ncbi:unnamed protein product [Boreogadus saida]